MKQILWITGLLFCLQVQAGEYRPGVEYVGVIQDVNQAGVKIDGRFYRVPGGTLLKRGKGKRQVRVQLEKGMEVLFSVRPGRQGRSSGELAFIEPMNSALDEAE